jgi:hypothetical protein
MCCEDAQRRVIPVRQIELRSHVRPGAVCCQTFPRSAEFEVDFANENIDVGQNPGSKFSHNKKLQQYQ